MSETQSQLAEVDSLIAAAPDDPALQQLREDLLQLIALEEQESAGEAQPILSGESSEKYVSQGTFMEHVVSKEAVAEAPDLGAFQPVTSSSAKSAAKSPSQPPMKNGDEAEGSANLKDNSTNADAAKPTQPSEKKKKKKKKKSPADDGAGVLTAKFELPSHLVPLESDTPAQKLKKQRTAKALKSKFREKISIAEHSKRQNDWTSFAGGGGGKKRKKGGAAMTGKMSSSIFSTEEGVNARVGVISGGGGRKMTDFVDPNKRHKFS